MILALENVPAGHGPRKPVSEAVSRLSEAIRERRPMNNRFASPASVSYTHLDVYKRQIEDLMQQGAVSFVFDVRGNNSDSIYAANDLLSLLLPVGDLGTIVYRCV